MNLTALSTIQIAIIIAVAVLLVVSIAILFSIRKRKTARLRTQFGGAEYNRAVKEGGSRQKAEAVLDKRADRVESFHIQPLGPGDRTRFVESWRSVQARFVDGPGGAVTEADQLLREGSVKPMRPVDEILLEHPRLVSNEK